MGRKILQPGFRGWIISKGFTDVDFVRAVGEDEVEVFGESRGYAANLVCMDASI